MYIQYTCIYNIHVYTIHMNIYTGMTTYNVSFMLLHCLMPACRLKTMIRWPVC